MLTQLWSPVPDWATAQQLQLELRQRVCLTDRLEPPQTIAGVDVAFPQGGTLTRAAVVVLRYPDLTLLDQAIAEVPTTFPYRSGFLSFREIPAILQALEQLPQLPDLIFCDGQGIAHPRRFGIACHLGVLLDKPTLGVAKSRLIGHHDPVPPEKGAWVPLWDHNTQIGIVLRSRKNVKPLYLSPGHHLSLETTLHYVQHGLGRYRLPEPTRLADQYSKRSSIVTPETT